MNLVYYKSDIGNFGDDLNPWLWAKIFGDLSKYRTEFDFIGIGSLLDSRIDSESPKIIFGSGVRDPLFTPALKKNDDVRFVRGPISSKVFGNAKYITDSAYCLALLDSYKDTPVKKFKKSFIPYFRHVDLFDWKMFERISGIKVILPTDPVEKVIEEIRSSENILTAAMHGAILADIYRIPWSRVRFSKHGVESALTSEVKWYDWHKSMDIEDVHSTQFGFTFANGNFLNEFMKNISMLLNFGHSVYYLSEQKLFESKISELKEQVEYIKINYAI